MPLPAVISLFSGGGGLDLGFRQAGFRIAYAADVSASAIRTHQHNFPGTTSRCCDLAIADPRDLLSDLKNILDSGEAIGVIGGPPCQGFSRANARSRFDDPRNTLPSRYVDLIRVLDTEYDVKFLLFENVLGIRDARHAPTFEAMIRRLRRAGFKCRIDEYCSYDFGVPQVRRRVIVVGFRENEGRERFEPPERASGPATVRDAIGHLPEPTFFSRDLVAEAIPYHQNHWTMRPRSNKFRDPLALRDVGRSFRRLAWDQPSPTIAYGNREIHVHPNGTRRLSILEAMLLQGFPEDFVLKGTLSDQVEQVSNAVPPPLALHLANSIRLSIENGGEGKHAS